MKKSKLIPIDFPDEIETIRRESVEFSRLSATDRFLAIAGLMRFSEQLVENSSNREAIERSTRWHEDEWRRIHQDLFARSGK